MYTGSTRNQATKKYKNKLPHYNVFNIEGHHNRTEHGGAALLVHEEIPMKLVHLTDLQAIAMEVYIDRRMTVFFIYNSGNHSLTEELLNNLIRQLPLLIMIMGDFKRVQQELGV